MKKDDLLGLGLMLFGASIMMIFAIEYSIKLNATDLLILNCSVVMITTICGLMCVFGTFNR